MLLRKSRVCRCLLRSQCIDWWRAGNDVEKIYGKSGAEKYKDGCWVEIEGTITKGEYHGEIPVIEIERIKETKTPNDEYVYPPDESYVPTSATL